jgi:SAM-dependent MidA family methyltransferase
VRYRGGPLSPLDERVAARIRAEGPLSFAAVMGAALYGPDHGFYRTGGAAGRRRGDFITSPEVGPLFGAVVARALDDCWRDLGEPDPFTVVEAGAGVGTLAVTIRAARPACAAVLRYVLVEQSPGLRARHGDHLPPEEGFTSAGELPEEPVSGVVLANELLDNLPIRLLEHRDGTWLEVHVDVDRGGALIEVLQPPADDAGTRAAALAPDARDGARIPLADAAVEWVARARNLVARGSLLLIDYGDTTAALAARSATDWLRTYRAHERGGHPLEALGTQDVTAEVPIDQFPGFVATRQADWLRAHGIDGLVEEGRRIWHERTVTDLAAIRARSRVHEAEALLDPAGLGAFWVLSHPAGGTGAPPPA